MGSTDDVFKGSERDLTYVIISMVMSILGTLASIIMIILIYRMKSTTGHVHLVLVMSVYQLLYDVTFFFSDVNCGYYVTVFADIIQLIGGVAASAVSNWIAFIALYIVWYRQKFDIFGSMATIHVTSFLPGFIAAVIFLIASVPKTKENDNLVEISIVYIYNDMRMFSIFLNFVFVSLIMIRIFRSGGNANSPQEIAIRTLARRMVYYPVIQAISRSGSSWYEFAYGTDFEQQNVSDTEYSAMIFSAVITPTVSIGYLFIFLAMQPNAYREIEALFCCRSSPVPVENKMESNPSFTTSTETNSTRATEADFDVHLEGGSRLQSEVELPTSRSTVSRFSTADWARKSYRYTTADLRDEDELYAIVEEDENALRESNVSQVQQSGYRPSSASMFPLRFPSFRNSMARPSDIRDSSVGNQYPVSVELSSRPSEVQTTENILHRGQSA